MGADALGLVFYPPSPRAVTVAQAQAVVAALPPFVTVVALFVDEQEEAVRDVLANVRVDLLQFHGDESPEYCRGFGRPYMKAIRMAEGVDLAQVAWRYHDSAGLLLDAWHPDAKGGTGAAFDWERVPAQCSLPIVLAGGLTPDNVRQALAVARPYALDVSSGVESAKGIKDFDKMAAFLNEVYEFERTG
ncbi:N-(5'-phosphoribosyl)anthranilate isomerase [Methylogaea oryzae]|uniref:N-(5'-phosphoribosyl)anthranilate isomerase n=1 Tax=Methylogaea oryzae TaxID=1295382 RepID=A0A8D4VPK0_9GAMM|nr:N-(5'-phosphoribosyl)anthranilate isomerase [Methylogaea oryzae]